MKCKDCGSEYPAAAVHCPVCGMSPEKSPEPDMLWYDFLSKFGFWAAGVFYFLAGGLRLLGILSAQSDPIYAPFESLRAADILLGAAYIALGFFALFVGFSLLKKTESAPTLTVSFFGIAAIVGVVYTVLCSIMVDGALFTLPVVGLVVLNAALCVGNMIYFSKRTQLF
ncbi:MAG: hypothetical protein IJP10_01120 [Clostridia bacterium]|nr:hypothetical protein [Clostridia bacterium]